MNFGVARMLAAYLGTSAAALLASVKLACVLDGQTMLTLSGNFFH